MTGARGLARDGRRPHALRRCLSLAVGALVVATTALALPAAGALGGDVYSTDFSEPALAAREWRFTDGATSESFQGYTLTMAAGAYTVALDGANNVWTSPRTGDLPDDQVVETTIATATGDPSLTAGVVCRGSLENDQGYAFFIGLDGYYSIGAFSPSGPRLVVNPKGTKRTDAIDPAGPNTVRGRCTSVGARKVRLTMFVNDERVASVVDRTSRSKIGPGAYLITEVAEGTAGSVTFSSFSVAAA